MEHLTSTSEQQKNLWCVRITLQKGLIHIFDNTEKNLSCHSQNGVKYCIFSNFFIYSFLLNMISIIPD